MTEGELKVEVIIDDYPIKLTFVCGIWIELVMTR